MALAFVLFVALGALVLRATIESSRSLRLADEAQAVGDFESTVLHLRHAAQWYVPLVGSRRGAVERMIALGDQAGDPDSALFAWRSARGAILSVRHVTVPHGDLLPALHQRIGTAMAGQAQALHPGTARSAEAYTAELDAWRTRQPRPVPAFLASVAFVGWLVALALAGWRGLGADGRPRRALAGWLAASVALLVLWITFVRIA